jgi:hypothetical protein
MNRDKNPQRAQQTALADYRMAKNMEESVYSPNLRLNEIMVQNNTRYCRYCCMPARQDHRGILGHPCFAWYIAIFNICNAPLVLYHTLHCEPRPVSHASLAVGLSAKCRGQDTNMTFVLEACD